MMKEINNHVTTCYFTITTKYCTKEEGPILSQSTKSTLGLYYAFMRHHLLKVLIALGPGILQVHLLFFFKPQVLAACFTY